VSIACTPPTLRRVPRLPPDPTRSAHPPTPYVRAARLRNASPQDAAAAHGPPRRPRARVGHDEVSTPLPAAPADDRQRWRRRHAQHSPSPTTPHALSRRTAPTRRAHRLPAVATLTPPPVAAGTGRQGRSTTPDRRSGISRQRRRRHRGSRRRHGRARRGPPQAARAPHPSGAVALEARESEPPKTAPSSTALVVAAATTATTTAQRRAPAAAVAAAAPPPARVPPPPAPPPQRRGGGCVGRDRRPNRPPPAPDAPSARRPPPARLPSRAPSAR